MKAEGRSHIFSVAGATAVAMEIAVMLPNRLKSDPHT